MQQIYLEEKSYPLIGERLYKVILGNGLRVFLLPKREFNEAYGIITVNFGSICTHFKASEDSNRIISYPSGIAHFLEHQLFERENGGDILQDFSNMGSESNAFTSFTNTSYLFSTIGNVSENLSLLRNLVSRSDFTIESIEREKAIIHQEIEMYQDDPNYQLFKCLLENLYPGSPLAEDIGGSISSIQDITVENLQDAFRRFYHPSNMGLFLVGNFDLETVKIELEDWDNWDNWDNGEEQKFNIEKKLLDTRPLIVRRIGAMDVSVPKLGVGFRGEARLSSSSLFRYQVLLKLLFSMMFGWTSKRYQHLYETGKVDHSLSLDVEVEEEFCFVVLSLDTKEPIEISDHIRMAIKNFSTDLDVSVEHLDIVKNEMYGDFLEHLNSLKYIATHYDTRFAGDNLFDLLDILRTTMLEDVLEVGHWFIDRCYETDFIILPK